MEMKVRSVHIRRLIYVHILAAMLFVFLFGELNFPWSIFYLLDLFLIPEAIFAFLTYRKQNRHRVLNSVLLYLLLLGFLMLCSSLLGGVSIRNTILSFRRVFRFFAFFLICAIVLEPEDLGRILKTLDVLFVINIGFCLVQFFFRGKYGDHLGGIFGTEVGSNVYSNIFLCVICLYHQCRYMCGRDSIRKLLLYMGISLVLAAMMELKVFFSEITVIVAAVILFFKPTRRTIKILLGSVAAFLLGVFLFVRLFPEQVNLLFNWRDIIEYSTRENWGYHIGRLSAVRDINRIFFHDDPALLLFGYGFGNCEEGTEFFRIYGGYHYTWFTHQVMILETGILGLLAYCGYYAVMLADIRKRERRNHLKREYAVFASVLCLLCFIWIIYNQALRMEIAYLVFALLAVPYIMIGRDRPSEKRDGR